MHVIGNDPQTRKSPGHAAPGSRDPFSAADIRLGARDAIALALSVLPWGFVFGLLSKSLFTFWQSFALSAGVYSGTAQFVALDQWGPSMSLGSLLVTVFAVNARYLLQGASLAPWFRGVGFARRVGVMLFLTDMNWALSLPKLVTGTVGLGYLLGAGVTIYSAWVVSSVAGYLAPMPVAESARLGLDFAVTAALIGLAGASYAGRASLLPWAVAAVVAALVYRLVPGNAYILAGGMAGALAGAYRGGEAAGVVAGDATPPGAGDGRSVPASIDGR